MDGVDVGIDVAKDFHWVCVTRRADSAVLITRRLDNRPAAVAEFVDELLALGDRYGRVRAGVDVLGGVAALVSAMLVAAGIELVHVSGLAVNRARQGTIGGEHKSDPRDAAVIADLVRQRRNLRRVDPGTEIDTEIRLLVGRRRDLVDDQTRRINRLRDLLVSILPGLQAIIDPTTKTSLQLPSRYVTPGELRHAGRGQIIDHLLAAGRVSRARAEKLADAALAAAEEQQLRLPGERLAADMIRELALEIAGTRARLAAIDDDIQATLAKHPDAALILSLPGMGATLTAEFIAEAGNIDRFHSAAQLAAAAGLIPVLKQSGKTRYLQRAHGANKTLKRVFFQSAFCSLNCPASKEYHARKRRERKTHHQAVIALARRRVDVRYAMLRNRQPYELRAAAIC